MLCPPPSCFRSRQALVYLPQAPFPFDALIASGRILVAPSLADPRLQAKWGRPAVVLVPLCSLAAGAEGGRGAGECPHTP